MKRLLPSSLPFGVNSKGLAMRSETTKGFTLIELLVVISIIAILAVIGMVMLGGLQGRARDAERRAEVDAILKAYEIKHDAATGKYPAKTEIGPRDFADGVRPVPPESTSAVPASYSEILPANLASVTVCAALEGGPSGNPTSCTASTTPGCYCKSGAQGPTGAANPPPPPPQCNDLADNDGDGDIDLDDAQCTDAADNDESS